MPPEGGPLGISPEDMGLPKDERGEPMHGYDKDRRLEFEARLIQKTTDAKPYEGLYHSRIGKKEELPFPPNLNITIGRIEVVKNHPDLLSREEPENKGNLDYNFILTSADVDPTAMPQAPFQSGLYAIRHFIDKHGRNINDTDSLVVLNRERPQATLQPIAEYREYGRRKFIYNALLK